MKNKNINQRQIRHKRIRKKVKGTAQRPRLCVFRSLKGLSAQIIDDIEGNTLVSASTFDKASRAAVGYGGNLKAAEKLGQLLASKAKGKGVSKVVFDRCGYAYHGRIKAFAESARKAGLGF